MAPPKKPWFRVYCEITRDAKMRSLTPEERWTWVAIMSLARSSPISGHLMLSERMPMTEAGIADEAGVSVGKLRKALRSFEALAMLHHDTNLDCWAVSNWSTRQYESDDASQRSQRHRTRRSNTDATAKG